MGLLSEVTCMPAVSTGQDGVEMTETHISSNFVLFRQTMESFAWGFWSCPHPCTDNWAQVLQPVTGDLLACCWRK